MSVRSHNSAYSGVFILSATPPKVSGGSLQLVDGQIALTKEKTQTVNGQQVVASLSQAAPKDEFRIQVGTGRQSEAGNITNKNMRTVPFKKDEVLDVTYSAAKAPVLASVTLGYNGVAGTGMKLKEKQATTVSLRLEGEHLSYLGFNEGVANLEFTVFAGNPDECVNCAEPCSTISCKDVTTDLVDRIRNHELRPGSDAGTGASVKVSDIIDVIPRFSCSPTATPTATYTYYNLTVLDSGNQEALAIVAAQYPNDIVTRVSYTGITSVYQILKLTGTPAAFAPETSNQILFDCDCPAGFTEGAGGFVYSIQLDDAGADVSATLLDNVIGVSDTAGAVFGTSYATSAAGLTPGTNTGETGTASASGTGATFTVVVGGGGTVTSVTLTAEGSGYVVGETITIAGTALTGGASPDDDIVVTVTSLSTVGEVIKTYDNYNIGTYTVSFASELSQTQIDNILAVNDTYTVSFVGEGTTICIPDSQPSTIAWVAGESCTLSSKQFYIDLKDTECGESRLAELQEAYPTLTITIDSSTTHTGCRQRYLTTVTSDIICDGCEVPEYVFETPADYSFESWYAVEPLEAALTSFTSEVTAGPTGMTTTPTAVTLENGSGVTYTGAGTGAIITIAGSTATEVDRITLTSGGTGYEVGETFTIVLADALDGSETGTLVLTITGVNGEYPLDCECGITFKAKEGYLCPPAMLTNNGMGYASIKPTTPQGIKIQVSGGEAPPILPLGYKFVTTPFKVTYDSRHFEGTGWGISFMSKELGQVERFLGVSHPRNYAEGWLSGFETKLEPCSQYDTITVKIKRKNYAGTQSRQVEEHIRYIFVFDSGRLCDYAALFNSLGGNLVCAE